MHARVGFFLLSIAMLLAASGPGHAATVADRSPFTQGQWSDPTRAGNGFELFSVGNQGMAIWFTFDDARNPVWYTAQGEIGTTWTLLKTYWAGVVRGASVPVGTLRLDFHDDAQADANFTLNGRSGTWRIEPFMPGTKNGEVDHSGSYYDPANPGWGYTLTEQGDVLGGVLYTYDANGFPTWVAGFARNSGGSVPVLSLRGPCPGCDAAPLDRLDGGRIDIEFLSDREARLRLALNDPTAPGLAIDGAKITQLGRAAADRPADRVAASFSSDAELKSYLVGVMPNMAFGNPGVTGGSPPPAPSQPLRLIDSGAGTEECDIAKSSDRYVYTFGHDQVSLPMAYLRVAEVGGNGRSLDVRADRIPLASGFNTPTQAAALCVGSDALATIAGTQPYGEGMSTGTSSGYMKGRTYVEVFGLADSAQPASRWWAQLDGHVLTSFRVGERLYVVLRHAPTVAGLDYRFPAFADAANREVLAAAPLSTFVPQARVLGGDAVPLVATSSVWLASQGFRRRADFITVVAIDLVQPRIADAISIVGPATSAHVSDGELLISGAARPGTDLANASHTVVHRVRLDPSGMSVSGSGVAAGSGGSLLADTQGVTRIDRSADGHVRFLAPDPQGGTKLTVLASAESDPAFLRATATLPNASRTDPLPTGVTRFAGDRLYLAGDGRLSVLDLSDPADPKVAGSIDSRGGLASLHPLPDGRLLATGQELGFFGLPANLNITLYDTRDATSPREVQRVVLGPGSATTALAQQPYAFAMAPTADGTLSFAFPAQVPGAPDLAVRLELVDPRSFDAGLLRRPDLLAPGSSVYPAARALLFPEGAVYVGAGLFWRQDTISVTSGPF